LWSATPYQAPPLLSDLAAEAAEATDTVEVEDGYTGPATVITDTVSAGDQPRTFVLAETDAGRRCVAWSEDPDHARAAGQGGLVGRPVVVADGRFGS
jgi:hypothetical protein